MKDAGVKGYGLEWGQAVFAIAGSKFVTLLSIIVAIMIVVLSAAKDHVNVGKWMRVGPALFSSKLSFPVGDHSCYCSGYRSRRIDMHSCKSSREVGWAVN